MAREGKPGRGSDQFPLRLPNGMRDRIKAAASRHGVSMNEEIVNVLSRAFPSISLSDRLYTLKELAKVLRPAGKVEGIDTLIEELHELLADIGTGVVKIDDEDARLALRDALTDFEIDEIKESQPYPAGERE